MKKKYTSVVIGHVTIDENIDCDGFKTVTPGGAVLYSTAAAHAMGYDVLAVTRCKKDDSERLGAFTVPKEDIIVIDSPHSVRMRNRYFTKDKEKRECRCLEMGTPFELADIGNYDAEIYQFAGLLYGDYSNEMIEKAARTGKVALDVQACLRHADAKTGEMYFEDWKDKREMLPYISYLKLDAAEAYIMTGTEDRRRSAELLYDMGAREILITHNTEVIAFDGDRVYSCPIKSRQLSGRTGRGDTTFAAYINSRTDNDIAGSLLLATAAVSLKMETPGPFKGTRDDVLRYIEEFYG